MSESRLGRQTPTVSVVLPYQESRGQEAVDLYNKSGRTAQEWQARMVEDIMATDENGLWVHMKCGWSIPRRNGKSEILIMREIWGLLHGERVLHTAHRQSTATSAWEKVGRLLAKMGFVEDEDFKTYKSSGRERIEWLKDGSEALINFRTRTTTGGLGEGYDLLIIDEAQEYRTDQETALSYIVTDSKNPQTLMCGTPPTAVSSGTVFLNFRKDVLTGGADSAYWAEWSVPRISDVNDVDLWYDTNPSLGTILTERTVRNEKSSDEVDRNIQRLGLWLPYSQKSAISQADWERCAVPQAPEIGPEPRLFFGVKYAQKSGNVSLSAAVKTEDGRIFIEAIDCRPIRDGFAWMMPYLRNPHAASVCIDGKGNASLLASDIADAGAECTVILPTVKQVTEAHALFEQHLFAGTICHRNQPALKQAATNCEHRSIAGGGFGYVSILEGADISLLESAVFAVWQCANAREPVAQIITY